MPRENESQDGVDAAFAEIVAGLELPLPDESGAAAAHGADDAQAADDGPAPETAHRAGAGRTPQDGRAADAGAGDEAAHTTEEPAAAQVALMLPGVDSGEAMAAVCRLAGVDAVCVPSDVGTIVCLTDASQQAATNAAAAFSGVLRSVPVVLLRRGPSDDPTDSDVQAFRYFGGQQQDRLAPGLLLAQAPDVIEGLILGSFAPRDVPGALASGDLSKLKATRILARLLRGLGGPGRRGA